MQRKVARFPRPDVERRNVHARLFQKLFRLFQVVWARVRYAVPVSDGAGRNVLPALRYCHVAVVQAVNDRLFVNRVFESLPDLLVVAPEFGVPAVHEYYPGVGRLRLIHNLAARRLDVFQQEHVRLDHVRLARLKSGDAGGRFRHDFGYVLGELGTAVFVVAVRRLVEVVVEAFEFELLAWYLVNELHRAAAIRVVLVGLVFGLGYIAACGVVSGHFLPVVGVEYLAVLALGVLRIQERGVRPGIGEHHPQGVAVNLLYSFGDLRQAY